MIVSHKCQYLTSRSRVTQMPYPETHLFIITERVNAATQLFVKTQHFKNVPLDASSLRASTLSLNDSQRTTTSNTCHSNKTSSCLKLCFALVVTASLISAIHLFVKRQHFKNVPHDSSSLRFQTLSLNCSLIARIPKTCHSNHRHCKSQLSHSFKITMCSCL